MFQQLCEAAIGSRMWKGWSVSRTEFSMQSGLIFKAVRLSAENTQRSRRRSSRRKTRTTGSLLQYIIEPFVPSRNATSCPFGPSASRLPPSPVPQRPWRVCEGTRYGCTRKHTEIYMSTHANTHFTWRAAPYIGSPLDKNVRRVHFSANSQESLFSLLRYSTIPYNETPNGALESEVLNYAILYIVLCR